MSPFSSPITDFGPEFDRASGPFMDTAAVMHGLDLVITSDTSIPHLAGAMGRPVWVALNHVPDWRWFDEREDCPWYPTMRLFRQTRSGDWSEVFERIATELVAVVQRDTSRLGPATTGSFPVQVPSAPGELIDRITILEIKCQRIQDAVKLDNIRRELALLETVRERTIPLSQELGSLTTDLKQVNEQLWEIEDQIRACEAEKDFGGRFVELARSVYRTNDRRAAIKREMNLLLRSELIEEKAYREYD